MARRIGVETFTNEKLKDVAKVDEELMKMDPVSLRAFIRQSAHRIDIGTQFCYILAPDEIKAGLVNPRSALRLALKAWERRGYETDKRDIKYAYDALRRGDEFDKTLTYKPTPPHAPYAERDLKVVERLIIERRSIRRFSNRDVPDELLNKVLEAGTWAPCACSLQGARFFVTREAETKKLIVQPWAAPVIIVGGLDERAYEFIKKNQVSYNPYLDLGAAIQSMLLMAHALGLGTAWATFAGEVDLIRRALKVPDYIKIITYFVLGWPDDEPITVPRMELKEFVSRETWSGEETIKERTWRKEVRNEN